MDEDKSILEIKILIKDGRTNLAINKLIWLCQIFSEDDFFIGLENETILLSSRLHSIERRLTQGIVKLDEVQIVENSINIRILNILNEIKNIIKKSSKNIIEKIISQNKKSDFEKLIGSWICKFVNPMTEKQEIIIWKLTSAKKSYAEFYDEYPSKLISKNKPNSWEFKDGIFYEELDEGEIGEGLIEWINENEMIFTITNNFNPFYAGIKKVYKRLNDNTIIN